MAKSSYDNRAIASSVMQFFQVNLQTEKEEKLVHIVKCTLSKEVFGESHDMPLEITVP